VYESTNNIYSLWLSKEAVLHDDMILLDSDIVFDHRIIGKLVSSHHENCLALKRHDVGEEEIKVKADLHGRITEISKKVIPLEAVGESIGIEKFGAKTVSRLFDILDRKINSEKNVNLFYETAFEELIQTGESIFAVDITEYACMEIDTASDLQSAGEMISKIASEKTI